ncbi:hypothetical protein KC19_9G043200 [Ceratodon purpureus]|uniref:Uncharacterized protein n=1 Tax=Ceratodon purpureus TaxID=3225 RepID=A0A8T0GS58_CERPU|nr:hypothetical protein KC19_9G043200 [Ceratodon purpureus]
MSCSLCALGHYPICRKGFEGVIAEVHNHIRSNVSRRVPNFVEKLLSTCGNTELPSTILFLAPAIPCHIGIR